jgi:hypothetical protein
LRAEECRVVALELKSQTARLQMIDVADSYEKMADVAEATLAKIEKTRPPQGQGPSI